MQLAFGLHADVCYKIVFLFQAPDGMTIDEDGMLWVAMYNGWKASIHMKM